MHNRFFLTAVIYCLASHANAGFAVDSSYVPPPPGPYQSKALSNLKPHDQAMGMAESQSEPKISEQNSPLMRPKQKPWLNNSGAWQRSSPAYGYNYPQAPAPMPPRVQQRPYYFSQNPVAPMEYYGNNNSTYGYPRDNRQSRFNSVPRNNYMQQPMPNRQMNVPPMWNNFRVPMSNYPQLNRQPTGSGSQN